MLWSSSVSGLIDLVGTICIEHNHCYNRSMGVHISKIRSVTMDNWDNVEEVSVHEIIWCCVSFAFNRCCLWSLWVTCRRTYTGWRLTTSPMMVRCCHQTIFAPGIKWFSVLLFRSYLFTHHKYSDAKSSLEQSTRRRLGFLNDNWLKWHRLLLLLFSIFYWFH